MAKQIYRQEALDRLASPDRLDQLMPLTSVRGWIALAAAGLLALVAVAWASFGSIAVTASAEGILTRGKDGVVYPPIPEDGKLTKLKVQLDDEVTEGQPLAELETKDRRVFQITSPINGRVLAVQAREGDSLSRGSEAIKLEAPDKPLQAILFLSVAEASRLKVGNDVRIWSGLDKLSGKVQSKARFPMGHAQLTAILQSEEWATSMVRQGPVVEVVVTFSGSEAQMWYSGTPCRAEITVARQRPIAMLLPGEH